MRSLMARKRISCTTALPVEEIQRWGGVESVTRDREQLHITANNADAIVRRLVAADENFQNLEVLRAGLADAFTELTQEVMQ